MQCCILTKCSQRDKVQALLKGLSELETHAKHLGHFLEFKSIDSVDIFRNPLRLTACKVLFGLYPKAELLGRQGS